MKARTIPLSQIQAAIEAGRRIDAHWNGCWQSELIEIILRLRLWKRMLWRMQLCGHRCDRGPVRRVVQWGRPGYVLPHWNDGPPREDWQGKHSPATAWDGIIRELYPSLAEGLRAVAYGHGDKEYLRTVWRIEIDEDATDDAANTNDRQG